MTNKQLLQPIDKISISLMLVMLVIISVLMWGVGKTVPKVRSFSWNGKTIGAEDTAFILTFSRPMEQASVEKNLRIIPPLPGKFSWAGRKLAYTLESPAPYGNNYRVTLEGAKEQFQKKDGQGKAIEPFETVFRTRDRAFAYIGVGNEEGQLILQNLTTEQKVILTPHNLVVSNFEAYPQGDKILFSATSRKDLNQGLQTDKLYTVTTGINPQPTNSDTTNSVGTIELILDSKDYQNLKFDLSQNGENIVIQRLSRQDPTDFALWLLTSEKKEQRLERNPGGDFLIAPDSETIAITQGEGIELAPLDVGAKAEPLDFLPKYGRILDFSRDGSTAAMVNFNTNDPELRYTQSLHYVNNQGVQKKLFTIPGSIRECKFDPTATKIYCILAQRVEDTEEYREQPYLAVIDLKKEQAVPIAFLPNQLDIHISVSNDGLGLLFDQAITSSDPYSKGLMITSSGETIVDGKLWLLITSPSTPTKSLDSQLQKAPLSSGIRPRWLP